MGAIEVRHDPRRAGDGAPPLFQQGRRGRPVRAPPEVVSDCIARGWSSVGAEGTTVPIGLRPHECGDFVFLAIGRPLLSPLVLRLKHPLDAVWAEGCEARGGSTTEYHRALRIPNRKIDHVVEACQEPAWPP
jgi:hypothetical protein